MNAGLPNSHGTELAARIALIKFKVFIIAVSIMRRVVGAKCGALSGSGAAGARIYSDELVTMQRAPFRARPSRAARRWRIRELHVLAHRAANGFHRIDV